MLSIVPLFHIAFPAMLLFLHQKQINEAVKHYQNHPGRIKRSFAGLKQGVEAGAKTPVFFADAGICKMHVEK